MVESLRERCGSLPATDRQQKLTKTFNLQKKKQPPLVIAVKSRAGCDLLGGGVWGSIHPFVLLNPVLIHYKYLLGVCIHKLDPPHFGDKSHTDPERNVKCCSDKNANLILPKCF